MGNTLGRGDREGVGEVGYRERMGRGRGRGGVGEVLGGKRVG